MKLIGLFDSPYVRRVAVSMRLLDLDFEHVALSVFRNQDEMRQINPLVKVPMLVLDSGEKLIESTFILDYLDGVAAPEKRLMPVAGHARMQMQQHCAVALVATEKTMQVYYETNLRPKEFVYDPWVERCSRQMHDAFSMLDAIPSTGITAGAPINQADVTSAVALGFARYVLPDLVPPGRYPQLEKLAAQCEALSAFAQTPLE